MGLVDALARLGRCPQDGTRLTGRELWCRACNSTWAPLLYGTTDTGEALDADADQGRAYLRRKIREVEGHKLSVHHAPPRALSRVQGGGTLLGRSVDTPLVGRDYAGRRG
jgi:hypothetical protein